MGHTQELIARLSAAIALLSCLLLYLEARSRGPVPARTVRAVFVALAICAVATYFRFFTIPATGFYHRWEMFHYLVGSKYAPELGYEGLYRCTAVADAENGHREEVSRRRMRDLRDDSLVRAEVALRDPAICKDSFSPGRWSSFKRDIAFFRDLAGKRSLWEAMQTDHGFNPSPVWTVVGRALASVAPAGRGLVRLLALIDPLLMGATLLLLYWAFGWRAALVATIFWSTQAPSAFAWTGGAFLRQDWLLLAVGAMAFLRKRWFFAAGFVLAWSSLLRVFPLLLWLGPAVVMVFRASC